MSSILKEKISRFQSQRRSGARSNSSSSTEDQDPRPPIRPLPVTSSVCRRLFEVPPDHEQQNIEFAREELARKQRASSLRWNFDFENGRPLDGQLEWTRQVAASPYRRPPASVRMPASSTLEAESLVEHTVAAASRPLKSRENSPVELHQPLVKEPLSTSAAKHIQSASDDCDSSRVGASENIATSAQPSPRSAAVTASKSGGHISKSVQRQTSITDHFAHQKRSRSNVKTQERKFHSSENLLEESHPAAEEKLSLPKGHQSEDLTPPSSAD
eukprot:maker-scaffold143_size313727-snap-gene-1.28 protein:Tk09412 transcript:maker-scaffold143_size313727-snap-gene-1.28-mRNA-1 annotation:"hypothetical protein BRAFLDRAFT_120626"